MGVSLDYSTRRSVYANSRPGRPQVFAYNPAAVPRRAASVIVVPSGYAKSRSMSRAPSIGPMRIANARLTSVPPPARSITPARDNFGDFTSEVFSYRPSNGLIVRYHTPAPPPPVSKVVYIRDVTHGGSEYDDYEYEARMERREQSQAFNRFALGIGGGGPLYSSHSIPLRNASELVSIGDIRRRFVADRNAPLSQVQYDIYRMSRYQQPMRQGYLGGIGRGNLAALSFAGGRPIARRRTFYPHYPEDDLLRNDFRSFYNSIRIAANLGRSYQKPLALYQPLYKSKKSLLGSQDEAPRVKRESKWVQRALADEKFTPRRSPIREVSASPPASPTPPRRRSPTPPPREPTPPPREPTPPPREPTPPPKEPTPPPPEPVKKGKGLKDKKEKKPVAAAVASPPPTPTEEIRQDVTLPGPRKSVVELPAEVEKLVNDVPDQDVVVKMPKAAVQEEPAAPVEDTVEETVKLGRQASKVEEPAPTPEPTPEPAPTPVEEPEAAAPAEPEPTPTPEPVVETPVETPAPPAEPEPTPEPVAATPEPTPEPPAAEEASVEAPTPSPAPESESVTPAPPPAEEQPTSPVSQQNGPTSPAPAESSEPLTNGQVAAAEEEDEEASEIALGGKVKPGEVVSDFFGGGDEEELEEEAQDSAAEELAFEEDDENDRPVHSPPLEDEEAVIIKKEMILQEQEPELPAQPAEEIDFWGSSD